MTRTVVALYDDAATTDQVVNELTNNGFGRDQINVFTHNSADLIDRLTLMGVPEEQAGYYAEGINRGGVLATAQVDNNQVDETLRIMNRFNPVDVEQRVEQWRSSGWTGSGVTTSASQAANSAAERYQSGYRSDASSHTDDEVLEVVEEDVKVGKRATERSVRVQKVVEEVPVEEQVNLREEHVVVERRPINRPADTADLDSAFREESFEMHELTEEPVVAKEARVVEEVHLRKDVQDRTQTVRDTARRTDVRVSEDEGTTFDQNKYDKYDNNFRTLFNQRYGQQGYTYDQYEPAYRYGYTLANDANYQGREWNDVERDARTRWERDNQGNWENFKDAVRDAWDSVRGRK